MANHFFTVMIHDILYIIEVKVSVNQNDMEKIATEAIQQIETKNYHDITTVRDRIVR